MVRFAPVILICILYLAILSTPALAQSRQLGGIPMKDIPEEVVPGGAEELGIGKSPPEEGEESEAGEPEAGEESEAEGAGEAEETVPEAPQVTSDIEGPLTGEEKVYLNVQEADIKDVIKQISKATGRNFIIDDKIRGKITIISERPMTSEEAYQTFLSALEVAGYTTVKGPANVIKIVSLKDASKSPIPTHVDSTPYTDSFITRLIPLENISALDMSNAIKDLIGREGNLFAYPATNTLIITDSGSNIDRIMKIVKELDQEGPQQVMEIIPIRNARATDVAQMVQDLFEKEKGAAATRRRKTAEPEELAEVSKIIPDERTNSIIVLASKRAIENVRAIIQKLDSRLRPEEEGRIHVYYLKHANAKVMAETLSSLTAAAATKGAKGTDIAVARFEGGIKITADEGTNALIITALPKDFQTLIDKVISKLDIPRRQVYFEAVVMEMTLSKGSEYGVSGYGGAGVGSSLIGMGQTLGSPSLLGSILGGAATGGTGAWPALLGGLISSRTTDITYVGSDGTSSTLTVPAFSAFLTALATRGEANIVSTPNLLTLDNEEATMDVLAKEPMPGSTTFGASGVTTATSVDYKEAGLELKIKPQITEGDMVKLEIEQKLSGFATPRYSTNLNAPAMKERKIKTTVVTENGQTVVLAGLMDDTTSKSKRKIPLLGDIPILGFLFSTTQTSMSKSNLLIFITPHIIKDRTDFSAILKRKIEERNRFIDENFSKSRRRQIRDTIKTHREDLLEFRKPIELEPGIQPAEKGIIDIKKAPQAEVPRVSPVVTVPEREITTRGPAVSPGAPVESSVWKPVIPPPAYPKPMAPPVVEKPLVEKPVPTPPEAKKVLEPIPLPPAAAPAPAYPAVPQKEYKKPVIPTPAFEKDVPAEPSAKKVVPWIPTPPAAEEKPAVPEAEATKEKYKKPVVSPPEPKKEAEAAPVITAPKEEKKTWKKPTPGARNGEIDLAY